MNGSSSHRVFIDTNVWFSAFYGSKTSEKLIKAHLEGKIKAVISQQVLEELVRNVSSKIPQALAPLKRLLEASPPEIIADPKHLPKKVKNLVHPKDARILTAAIQAKVMLFVTGNIKDFNVKLLKDGYGIKILNPSDAIKTLRL